MLKVTTPPVGSIGRANAAMGMDHGQADSENRTEPVNQIETFTSRTPFVAFKQAASRPGMIVSMLPYYLELFE